MQTRPFFKNLSAKVGKFFFGQQQQQQQTIATLQPAHPDDNKHFNKSAGGSHSSHRRYLRRLRKTSKESVLNERLCPRTHPKLMNRSERERAGLQEPRLTWWKAKKIKEHVQSSVRFLTIENIQLIMRPKIKSY